jgi:hypothetical protein
LMTKRTRKSVVNSIQFTMSGDLCSRENDSSACKCLRELVQIPLT